MGYRQGNPKGPVLQNQRMLVACLGCLAFGGVLAFFAKVQLGIQVIILFAVALPAAALAFFVLLNGLPKTAKDSEATSTAPGGLGSFWMAGGLAVAAMTVFGFWPEFDLVVARLFFSATGGYVGRTFFGELGRSIGNILPFIVLAAYVLAWLANRLGLAILFSPPGKNVVFLILAMATGPGLIVNLGMKDHLHRPRPTHVVEFGGSKAFRAFYQFDGGCIKNCSFPSGEAAEAFWMLAPASLIPAPWRSLAIAGAFVFGTLVSLLRMAFGGHFLSDVTFAALIMWALLLVLRRVLYSKPSDQR